MAWLGVEHWMEPFRSDPRYGQILNEVGLMKPGEAETSAPTALRQLFKCNMVHFERGLSPALFDIVGDFLMSFTPGTRIGPYEITSILGQGGMGIVFRARDVKLDRDVAIKVLPEAFDSDRDRLIRFQREAQVLASLNHPRIAHVYGLEESGQTKCIVMELVEGETLAERIRRGPLPVDDSVEIVKQITDGLEAAHEKGITHRDLKPANIKIRDDGAIKILDFGLAKVFGSENSATDLSNSPTLNVDATLDGTLVGTLAYMSPEQARGRPVDARTDIWALGCVFYEMLAGKQAFGGETVSDRVAAVLRSEPDWDALPKETPQTLIAIIRNCLQKNPKERLHNAADVRIQLKDILAEPPVPIAIRSNRWLFATAVAGVIIAIAVILFAFAGRSSTPTSPLWLSIPPPPYGFGNSPEPAVSPDGNQIAFIAPNENGTVVLWVRSLDSPTVRRLPETEGAGQPFWSPDGKEIGFFALNRLKKIAVAGGSPQALAEAPTPRGGAWSKEGTILYVPVSGQGLYQIPASGGSPTVVPGFANENAGEYRSHPDFLPDSRHFVYSLASGDPQKRGVYVGSLNGDPGQRLLTASRAMYSKGFLLFIKDRELFSQAFDTAAMKLVGQARRVAEGIGWSGQNLSSFSFASSDADTLAYWTGLRFPKTQIQWFDRNGNSLGKVGQLAVNLEAVLSPDERRVAVEVVDAEKITVDIWTIELASGISSRFSSEGLWSGTPLWSPDSGRLFYSSFIQSSFVVKALRQAEIREITLNMPGAKWLTGSSADGRYLLFTYASPTTGTDIWVFDTTNPSMPWPLVQTPAIETHGQLSPDGSWVAYTSSKTGHSEAYINSFPKTGNEVRVSPNGGMWPKWSRNGNELFYFSEDRRQLFAVTLRRTADGLETGPPKLLINLTNAVLGESPERAPYAVTGDGQRFLLNVPIEDPVPPSLILGLNWQSPSNH